MTTSTHSRCPTIRGLFASLALLLFANMANAQSLAGVDLLSWIAAGNSGVYGGTVGYRFTVGSKNLQVSALGVYDSGTTPASGTGGLWSDNRVGIWTDTGTLLSSVVVKSGTDTPLEGHFRWQTLTTDTVLQAGDTYRIGSCPGAPYFKEPTYSGFLSPTTWWSFSMSPDATLLGTARGGEVDYSFAFPSDAGPSDQAIIGPNMQYTAIPEPASYAVVFSVAALGFASVRRLGMFRSRKWI